MFKFIRRYQKWMLVVFCGGLMVAFLVPQALDQFTPSGKNAVIAKIYDGQSITHEDRQLAADSLAVLRQLNFYGGGLFPNEKDKSDENLAWLLMVRAAGQAGLRTSDTEAFNALAMRQSDVTDSESLNKFAGKLQISAPRLLGILREYLLVVQYRDLVLGHTFEVQADLTDWPSSVGLNRVRRENDLIRFLDVNRQQFFLNYFQKTGQAPTEAQLRAEQEQYLLPRLFGRPRVSEAALRQALQQQRTQLSGALAVIDAEDSALPPGDDALQSLFDQYRGDFKGQGEPYGFGYRVPGRAQIEALRIPVEQLYAAAADQVSEADVRRYHDQHAALYADWAPRGQVPQDEPETPADTPADDANPTHPEPTDAETPAPSDRMRIDFRLRREIRQALIYQKTAELRQEIVNDLLRMSAEDTRVLEERDGFKVIPDDYTPTPLTEIAQRIQDEHGITLEVIPDNSTWVSATDAGRALGVVVAMARNQPTRSIWVVDPTGSGLQEITVPGLTLSGRLGLLSSGFTGSQGRPRSLGAALTQLKELRGDTHALFPDQPQVGLVLPILTTDPAESLYLTRVAAADPDHPAESLADVQDQVDRDARRLAGYQALLARRDSLVEQAQRETLLGVVPADEIRQLEGFSRANPPQIEDLSRASVQAFQDAVDALADQLRRGVGIDQTLSGDRLVVVELPRERKLLLFLLTDDQPLSQQAYRTQLSDPQSNILAEIALSYTMPAEDTSLLEAMSLEQLKRITGFRWADGSAPEAPEADGATTGDTEG